MCPMSKPDVVRSIRTISRMAWAITGVCLLGGGGPLSAQEPAGASIDPDILATWEWRSIGPNLGGRSIASAGSVSRPLEYYFGAAGGGLWKTTDAGTTWFPVSDGWFESASVGSVGICEANPDVVYVGMGEGQFRGTMSSGDGAYGTRDGGNTWTHLGLSSSTGQTAIPRMRVHPNDCDHVYAAVLGDQWGANPERGVYRSRDGGRSWEQVLFRNDLAGASDLMLDPSDPATLYATIWDVHRPPWGGRTNGTSGIFKSEDEGESWTDLTHNPGLPDTIIGKSAISVSGADPNRVYAVIEAVPGQGGVFRSDDGGDTWRKMNGNNALFHRADYYNRIYADPQNPDRVHVLNKNWFASDDGGATYTLMRPPHGDNHDLWIAPDDNRRMIQANDGGASVSWNGGRTWSEQDFNTSQMYHVYVTNDFPYLVCGAQQDSTGKCVPSDGDGSFWYQGPGGEQGYVAMHPTRTTLGFGGSQRGGISRFDRETGQRQDVKVWPRQQDGWPAGQVKERFQWTFPIIMSPHDADVLYAGSQHVWRTANGGHSWEQISPDLTRADSETLRGSDLPIKDYLSGDYYATIFTIALSPHDPDVIWTGSDDGLIHITRDGGQNWENVTPPSLPEFTKASLMEASPHTPGKAYLAAEKGKIQDVNPYIFRTEDYGQTWTKIVDGIPPGHFVRAAKEDPVRPGLLFAGTEHAPYVSLDDGASWNRLSLNLPDLQVPDLEMKDDDLVIATYGRGFHILDGALAVLRELTPDVLARPTHLFDPSDWIRTRSGPANGVDGRLYGRSRMPGANRVEIYYRLASPAGRVALEILDARGQTVRTFTGTPDDQPSSGVRNSVGHVISGPGWGSASDPPSVGTEAGLHRFVWDMRYPPAADFVGLRLRGANANGPPGPPGEYRVRLTVDGESQTQAFRILKDPRLTDVTQADLEAQFDLVMRVHERFDDATSAVLETRQMRDQIDDRLQRIENRRLTREGEALKGTLLAIEGAIYEYRAEAQSDLKHFGTRLTNHLANLKAGIMSADARPTEQSYEVYEEISSELAEQLSRLEQALTEGLGSFNALLRELNLMPIEWVGADTDMDGS